MVDMSKFRKATPGQDSHRRQWILDTIRENQADAALVLLSVAVGNFDSAKETLSDMHKQDRDALLQENGMITNEQLELLK